MLSDYGIRPQSSLGGVALLTLLEGRVSPRIALSTSQVLILASTATAPPGLQCEEVAGAIGDINLRRIWTDLVCPTLVGRSPPACTCPCKTVLDDSGRPPFPAETVGAPLRKVAASIGITVTATLAAFHRPPFAPLRPAPESSNAWRRVKSTSPNTRRTESG